MCCLIRLGRGRLVRCVIVVVTWVVMVGENGAIWWAVRLMRRTRPLSTVVVYLLRRCTARMQRSCPVLRVTSCALIAISLFVPSLCRQRIRVRVANIDILLVVVFRGFRFSGLSILLSVWLNRIRH